MFTCQLFARHVYLPAISLLSFHVSDREDDDNDDNGELAGDTAWRGQITDNVKMAGCGGQKGLQTRGELIM